MISLNKISRNNDKAKSLLKVYVFILLHIAAIFMILLYIRVGNVADKVDKDMKLDVLRGMEQSEIDELLNNSDQLEKLDQLERLGEIHEIYSRCNHQWKEVIQGNHYHITLTCTECGILQTISTCEDAIYINVE